jgi:chemotaxis protein MotB
MNRKKINLMDAQNAYQFPYIAVMTILCIFFLMMYAYYNKLFEESAAVRNENIAKKVKKDLSNNKILKDSTDVEVMEDGVKVTLQTSIIFDLGSANLKEWVVPTLGNLSESINALPEDYTVAIEGHTDNAPVWYGGDFASNWELSLYRSLSLIDLFVKRGSNPDRFAARGYGEYKPLFPNDTPEHRAANRRVEILIRKKSVENMDLRNVHLDRAA